jgi:hypothetical protein
VRVSIENNFSKGDCNGEKEKESGKHCYDDNWGVC